MELLQKISEQRPLDVQFTPVPSHKAAPVTPAVSLAAPPVSQLLVPHFLTTTPPPPPPNFHRFPPQPPSLSSGPEHIPPGACLFPLP